MRPLSIVRPPAGGYGGVLQAGAHIVVFRESKQVPVASHNLLLRFQVVGQIQMDEHHNIDMQ